MEAVLVKLTGSPFVFMNTQLSGMSTGYMGKNRDGMKRRASRPSVFCRQEPDLEKQTAHHQKEVPSKVEANV